MVLGAWFVLGAFSVRATEHVKRVHGWLLGMTYEEMIEDLMGKVKVRSGIMATLEVEGVVFSCVLPR